MKKKFLVLGSNSFSGSTFVNYLLNKNHSVFGTYHTLKNKINLVYSYNKNNKKFKNIRIDSSKSSDNKKLINILEKKKFDYIIDFSSICMVDYSWINPSYYFKVNVQSKIDLIQKLVDLKFKKYILISTPEVFGSTDKPLMESSILHNPSTPYALSKSYQEKYMELIFKKNNLNFNICRFSNFYGPGQATYSLIPRIIYSILFNKKIIIQGKGKAVRSFIFADDFCDGIYKVLNKNYKNKTFHFSNKEFLTIFEVYKTICKTMKVNYSNYFDFGPNRIHEDSNYKLNCKNSLEYLGWAPKYDIDRGITETINYFIKHKKLFLKSEINFNKDLYI